MRRVKALLLSIKESYQNDVPSEMTGESFHCPKHIEDIMYIHTQSMATRHFRNVTYCCTFTVSSLF